MNLDRLCSMDLPVGAWPACWQLLGVQNPRDQASSHKEAESRDALGRIWQAVRPEGGMEVEEILVNP